MIRNPLTKYHPEGVVARPCTAIATARFMALVRKAALRAREKFPRCLPFLPVPAGAVIAVVLAMAVWMPLPDNTAAAQTPFGVGVAGESGASGGFFLWIASKQAAFSREIQQALKLLKDSGDFPFWLIAISFIYGILHAAGPGHGKVVISSYVLATDTQSRRGILLAFAAAFMQALTAVAMGGVAVLLFNLTSIGLSRSANALVVFSYVLLTLIGVWLVWTRALGFGRQALVPASHRDTPAACDRCGHSHFVDPHLVRETLSFKDAWPIVIAVGIRPCTGALIVLAFAIAMGIFWAGVLATFAMAVGTATTVAILVCFAAGARNMAMRFTGEESRFAYSLRRGIEIAGSVAVLILGLSLLISAIGFRAV